MFSKFVNRFYYGKSGKSDYTQADLPKNRWELFFTTLKIRLSDLFKLNIIYVLIFLPAMFFIVKGAVVYLNAMNIFVETTKNMSTNEIMAQTELFKTFQHQLIIKTLIYLVPCILITGPITVGVSYDIRNWARDQHAFLWSDFVDAVKANWKQALGISTISALMPLLSYFSIYYYGEMTKQSLFFFIPQVLVIITCTLWWFALIYFYYLIISYELKFKDVIRNGLLITIARFPQSLAIKLLSLLPLAIGFVLALSVGIQIGLIFCIIYYLLIGLCLSRFAWASYSIACFDKLINPRIAGAETNIGLRPEVYKEIDDMLENMDDDEATTEEEDK